MKVKSTVVSPRYIRCGLELRLKFDSLTSQEMVNLELLKGDVVGHAKVKFVDNRYDRGLLEIHIFQK